jgi:hypothetical protein
MSPLSILRGSVLRGSAQGLWRRFQASPRRDAWGVRRPGASVIEDVDRSGVDRKGPGVCGVADTQRATGVADHNSRVQRLRPDARGGHRDTIKPQWSRPVSLRPIARRKARQLYRQASRLLRVCGSGQARLVGALSLWPWGRALRVAADLMARASGWRGTINT